MFMNEINTAKKIHNLSVSSSAEGLWQRFCKGDRDALGTIYRLHIDDLFHYGMHFCNDNQRVKDSLQDLFQTLWTDRAHLSADVNNIRYYLLTSLRRCLLRSLAKDRRFPTEIPSASFDFELIPPQEDVIIKDEAYQEKISRLHEGIGKLSRRQREAIYLRFYQNFSYSEVAEMMSMKIDSVYNLISKAIALLKNIFLVFLLMNILN
jgi:RNA polymerase sigma factor (sigma-70 family)